MALKIKFKKQSNISIGTILKNRGIAWFVREDSTGEEFPVPKKNVIETWDAPDNPEPACAACGATGVELNANGYCGDCESTAEDQEEHADPASILGQLGAAAHAEPPAPQAKEGKKKVEPVARDPNLVSLKELCFELEIEPRIARRMLRKAKGNIGTGSRWEWVKGSEELATVRRVLLKAEQ